MAYTKKHYSMGLIWNNKDGLEPEEALERVRSGSPMTDASAGGPPPPPPPPLPTADGPTQASAKSSTSQGDIGAVFNQLNRGEAVTAGLRKVDRSEMTHKNPSLRASGSQPQRSDSSSSTGRGKSPAPPRKPESMRTKRPPKKELEGNKWIIVSITGSEVATRVSWLTCTCCRNTLKMNNRQLRLKRHVSNLSSFHGVADPRSESSAKPMPSP